MSLRYYYAPLRGKYGTKVYFAAAMTSFERFILKVYKIIGELDTFRIRFEGFLKCNFNNAILEINVGDYLVYLLCNL